VRDKLYKYFTLKNTYRYVDVLSDFVSGYNATVHGSTGKALGNVTDSDILALWKRMQKRRANVRVKIARYSVGQHIGISKEKAKFAKSAEQNFSTEVFRIIKVIHITPRPVNELEYLNQKVIDGQFYEEELTPYASRNRPSFRSIKSSSRGADEALSNTGSVGRDTTRISTVGYRRPTYGKFKTWISDVITFTSHSIWERRHPSGKWAYAKSHMGAPRTNVSKRIRSLTRRWYLFIANSSHRNSWRIKISEHCE